MKTVALVLVPMILVGCVTENPTTPPDLERFLVEYDYQVSEVERLFLQEHPDYTVVRVTRDKWDRYADFTITYKKSSESSPQTVVWHYYYTLNRRAIWEVRKDPVK